jgi:hypothetical protein
MEAQAKLDEESVVTLETTSTDRHYAARAATKQSSLLYRYGDVTPMLADAHHLGGKVDPRVQHGMKVPKAVC